MSEAGRRVTIVGGGVAALEAMIALRGLAEERVSIELVTPSPDWTYRPMAVAEPFGLGRSERYDLVRIAHDHGAALHLAGVQAVDPDSKTLLMWDGRRHDYDLLLMAVGAQPLVAMPGSVTVKGPEYGSRFRTVLRGLAERRIRRVAFAVPAGSSWPLPLYELALMTAMHVADLGLPEVELSFVTPESAPLELFGPSASEAVAALLDERGVRLHAACTPAQVREGELATVPGGSLPVDQVVSLPRLVGPAISGLPSDPDGFIPVDLHGRVDGQRDVYAAGDATTCPIKQGGVACQQADAVAQAIAARLGADLEPQPFRPVLRGLLLTGKQARYLRAEVSGGRAQRSEASEHALWWPPNKIAGRWLAPYLALRHDELEQERPDGLSVDVGVDPLPLPA
jgi:sulfide:quinone oxidoreductase